MKYFKVTLTQQDGEHEHSHKFIAKAMTEQGLIKRIEKEQLYDCEEEAHELSMLSYGDGLTAVSKYSIVEIPEEHFDLLNEHNYMGQV